MPKCFSCPGDCKEQSKKTRRSIHDSNQATIKPWPTVSHKFASLREKGLVNTLYIEFVSRKHYVIALE